MALMLLFVLSAISSVSASPTIYDSTEGFLPVQMSSHDASTNHSSCQGRCRTTTRSLKKPNRRYRPRVREQAVEDMDLENPETFDEYFTLVKAFNLGFRIQVFYPAAKECTKYSQIFLNDQNATGRNVTTQQLESETYYALRNYTRLISNQFADAYLYCHMTGVDVYDYYLLQVNTYGDWVNWLQAALQNMVGNIIRINNLYQKMVVATENKDVQQTWYLAGRISFYLADIKPIEDAGYEIDEDDNEQHHASLTDIFRLVNKLADMQQKINSGEIQIADQHEAYWRSKKEFERLQNLEREKEMHKKNQSPSMSYILQQYAEAYKQKRDAYPMKQFLQERAHQMGYPLVKEEENAFNLIIKYVELGGLFFWEAQAASIGQVSGNLSVCQNHTLRLYNSSTLIIGQYERLELDEAGNSSYVILHSLDNIYTACYYMIFEYYIALNIYVETLIDPLKLLYNIIHNLGSLYDLTEELVYRLIDFEKYSLRREYWMRLGYITGANFQNTFEYPVNYDFVNDPGSYAFDEESRERFEFNQKRQEGVNQVNT